jgi:thioredoxin reductase (NADPH)
MKKYDVIIIGAGAAGLSAALYFAKAEMKALVIGDGRSQLNMAWLNNTYLGLEPATGEKLIDIGLKQIAELGVPTVEEKVVEVQRQEDLYVLMTEEGNQYGCEYLLLAGGAPMTNGHAFGVELEDCPEPRMKKQIKTDERGRTSLPNVYAAGVAAGVSSQAIIAAGHGAQVAINIISDKQGQRYVKHEWLD